MDYAKAFHIVAKASKESAVPCVLIGGFAINFYKVTRNTLDIDFLITKEDFAKIKNALLAAGYAEEFATDVAVRFSNKADALDVDFMIVDDKTRESIIKDGKTTEVVGEKLIIPSIDHLIALKLHAIKHNQKNKKKLKLPRAINPPERHKWLSMDDYIEFVNFNFRFFRRINDTEKDIAAMRVNAPFLIR